MAGRHHRGAGGRPGGHGDESRERHRALPTRILVAAAWWFLPVLVCTCVGGYFGLAVVRHVYPAAVPVEGTSMLPLLHAGDLVLLRHVDVDKLRKGDIIAFHTTLAAQRAYGVPGSYVHRIYQVIHGPNGIEFRTKGENVPGPDPFLTLPQDVVGGYDGYVPDVGYVVLFAHSRQGLILVGVLVLIVAGYYLLVLADRRAEEKEATTTELVALIEQVRRLAEATAEANLARQAPSQVPPEASGKQEGT